MKALIDAFTKDWHTTWDAYDLLWYKANEGLQSAIRMEKHWKKEKMKAWDEYQEVRKRFRESINRLYE